MKSATRQEKLCSKRPLSSLGCVNDCARWSSFSYHCATERSSQRIRSRDYSTHPRPTSTQDFAKRLTILDIFERYKKGVPITMLTAKDFPSATIIAQSGGIDIVLVGDSLGMTALGYESTVPVTMIDMVHHAKAVARGNKTSFLIGDLPFGSYEPSNDMAVSNAMIFVKEAGMNGIKLEVHLLILIHKSL